MDEWKHQIKAAIESGAMHVYGTESAQIAITVGTHEETGERSLLLNAIRGEGLFTTEFSEAFDLLARRMDCTAIRCRTRKTSLHRLIKRFGFQNESQVDGYQHFVRMVQ